MGALQPAGDNRGSTRRPWTLWPEVARRRRELRSNLQATAGAMTRTCYAIFIITIKVSRSDYGMRRKMRIELQAVTLANTKETRSEERFLENSELLTIGKNSITLKVFYKAFRISDRGTSSEIQKDWIVMMSSQAIGKLQRTVETEEMQRLQRELKLQDELPSVIFKVIESCITGGAGCRRSSDFGLSRAVVVKKKIMTVQIGAVSKAVIRDENEPTQFCVRGSPFCESVDLAERYFEEDIDYNETADVARKREQHVARVFQHYWRRWKKEYLIDLREYHKVPNKTRDRPNINIGDVVTVQDENIRNRIEWKLGRVADLIIGRDDVTRGARIQLANGNFIERPIQKLFPLELSSEPKEACATNENTTMSEDKQRKTKRKAAVIAQESIRIIDQLEEDNEL
eukprot:gene16013-7349_t